MANPYPDAPAAISDLIPTYERQPDELASLVAGMTSAQMIARPIKGRWSTLEVLAHLADSDEVLVDRIKRTIAMDKPLLMSFDETKFAERLNYQQHDGADELAALALNRRRVARVLRGLNADAWAREAVHSERGIVTLKQLVQMAVGHVNHHTPFIREKRAALGLK